jgi:hypothetical protein
MATLNDVLEQVRRICAINGLSVCEVSKGADFSVEPIYDNVDALRKELPCVTGYRINLTCELDWFPEHFRDDHLN